MAKTDLSRAAIVDRALELADAEGLDAVTVRRLGQEFGVTPMALYWHVKNKDELLDAMGDRLFETVGYDGTADPDVSWDAKLAAVIRGLVEAFRQHPVCVDLAYRRVLVCDDGRRLTEYTLGVLREAGFSPRRTADIAVRSLQTALMLVSSEPGSEPGHAEEDREALMAQKRAMLAALPAEQFPYLREMAGDMLHCDDVDEYYEFNVDLFVGGVRATLERADSAGAVVGAAAVS